MSNDIRFPQNYDPGHPLTLQGNSSSNPTPAQSLASYPVALVYQFPDLDSIPSNYAGIAQVGQTLVICDGSGSARQI